MRHETHDYDPSDFVRLTADPSGDKEVATIFNFGVRQGRFPDYEPCRKMISKQVSVSLLRDNK